MGGFAQKACNLTRLMVLAGLAMAVLGFAFLLNVGQAADRFAAMARPLPTWMTWPWANSPLYYRLLGGFFVAMGAVLLGAGLQS